MKKTILTTSIAILFGINASAQIYLTRNGKVSFFSKAPVENIEANNNEVTSFLNTKTGELAFVVLIKSFKFRKALMEEHFNEDYLESSTFPKANFKGALSDLSNINFSKDGSYPVIARGDLTIHGVTKTITAPGTVTVAQGNIKTNSKFSIRVRDYNIKIPSTVVKNIAETIDVTVDCKYDPFKKG